MKRIFLVIAVLMMGGLLAGFSFLGLGGTEETTLMVYMTGSDLESKGACATNDMQEMLDSGIDLSHTNLLVYTGGAKAWHNEDVTISPEVNGLYHLTASGFEEIDNFPLESMGDPANLTRFLDYAVEKYPADKYDLVFWDHGNGPVIGYGMDFLHNKDSLTLPEIREGLEASPFGPDNKLDIIGFDACLMASAELAYTVSDYADYLISSQETEPSFGWNYAFLKNMGKHSGKKLAKDITDAYMDYCNAIFKKNALYNTDVTISVMDLSKAKDVQKAVNALFEKAAGDVETSFTSLASARISTRSFGRATTGSEYDLVDIQSLAGLMQKKYPAEAKSVVDQVNAMTVVSRSNTDDACGVSLYYPFYNKSSYEEKWKDAYSQVEGFEAYCKYLENYEQHWLGTDLRRIFADIKTPEVTESGDYAIELTDAQIEQFAEGGYYILVKNGGDNYTVVFSSSDVELVDNKLQANFENKILYFANDTDHRGIVPVREWDTVEGVTRYSAFPRVADLSNPKDTKIQDTELQFSLDREKGTTEVTAFLESDEFVKNLFKGDSFANVRSGKRSELDTSRYEALFFNANNGRYLHRDKNGILYDYWDWPEDNDTMVHAMYAMADGIGFEYQPIYDDGFEYFLMIRYRDLQGNGYCSEPIAITTVEDERELNQKSYDWKDGSFISLYEDDEVSAGIYCLTAPDSNDVSYCLMVENNTDLSVHTTFSNLMINENIRDGYHYFYESFAPAGGFDITPLTGLNEALCFMGQAKPDRLSFKLEIQQNKGYYMDFPVRTICRPTKMDIRIGDIQPSSVLLPYHGAIADPQELAVIDDVRFDLVQCGFLLDGSDQHSSYTDMTLIVKVENQSNESKAAKLYGVIADNYFVKSYQDQFVLLEPGQTGYLEFSEDLAKSDNPSLEKLGSLSVICKAMPVDYSREEYHDWETSTPYWTVEYQLPDLEDLKETDYYPIQLSDNDGESIWGSQIGKELYADDDMVIYDAGTVVKDSLGEQRYWYLWIENHSDSYFEVNLEDILIDGIPEEETNIFVSTSWSADMVPGTGSWYYASVGADKKVDEIRGTMYKGSSYSGEKLTDFSFSASAISCEEVHS